MEDWRIEFPEVTDVQMVFGGYPEDWFNRVLETAEKPEDRKFDDMANALFSNGGKVPVNKELSEDYQSNGLRMLRAVLGSFEPKHEDKTKVCGLILKSLCS